MKTLYLTQVLFFISLPCFAQISNTAGIEASPLPFVIFPDYPNSPVVRNIPHVHFNAGVYYTRMQNIQLGLFRQVGLCTGIDYYYLRFNVVPYFNDAGRSPTGERYVYQTISIPLDIKFSFWNNPHLNLFFYAGFYPDIVLQDNETVKYANGDTYTANRKDQKIAPVYPGINAGVEVKYKAFGFCAAANTITSEMITLNLTVKYDVIKSQGTKAAR